MKEEAETAHQEEEGDFKVGRIRNDNGNGNEDGGRQTTSLSTMNYKLWKGEVIF